MHSLAHPAPEPAVAHRGGGCGGAVVIGGAANYPEIPDGSFSSQPIVDNSIRAYLSELAAEIVASGNQNGDLFEEMQAAHDRRQAFAEEMRDGNTDRARIARRVLAAQVYGTIRAKHAISAAMYEAACEVRP